MPGRSGSGAVGGGSKASPAEWVAALLEHLADASKKSGPVSRCATIRPFLNHIRTTTTDTGLSVVAQLVEQEYPTGVKIADAEFASIALQPHQTQPLRNYTICPRS